MTHNASPLVRALARIVVGDLEETVATATPASWREALAMVLTYAKDEQLVALCQQLGDRLEAAGCLDEALLCAVCAVDIPAVIRLGLQIHPDCSVRSHLSVAEALLILCSMTNPQTLDLPAVVSSTTSAQRLATLCVELQQRGMQSVASRLVAVLVRSPSARAVVEVLHAMDPALAPAVPAQTVQAAQPAMPTMPAVSAKPAKPVAVPRSVHARAAHAAHAAHAACDARAANAARDAEAVHALAARAARLPACAARHAGTARTARTACADVAAPRALHAHDARDAVTHGTARDARATGAACGGACGGDAVRAGSGSEA